MTEVQQLSKAIQADIEQHAGLLSFSQFMTLALYHPTWGYYQRGNIDIGRKGDFMTAPEYSPLFAQCLANQCFSLFANACPRNILEIGAGTGQLCYDLLQALSQKNSLPLHYFIYERSLRLRQKQQEKLRKYYPQGLPNIVWLDHLPDQFAGIIIANEVLDALPVDCFQMTTQGIQERFVTWEKNSFAWKTATPQSPGLLSKATLLHEQFHFPMDYVSEINLQLDSFIRYITDSLFQGVILFFDYGYGQAEYYHPARNQGTLTCFYQHQQNDNPFLSPGLQDITAHVDFTSVIECAVNHQCQLLGYTTQAAFLLANGLLEIANALEKTLDAKQAFAMHQVVKTLTMPTEMGERIKVMALGKNIELALPSLMMQDRRRELVT